MILAAFASMLAWATASPLVAGGDGPAHPGRGAPEARVGWGAAQPRDSSGGEPETEQRERSDEGATTTHVFRHEGWRREGTNPANLVDTEDVLPMASLRAGELVVRLLEPDGRQQDQRGTVVTNDRSASVFWSWFTINVLPSLVRDKVPPHHVIAELDGRMDELGLSWELGPAPDGSDDWAFAVSFGGDPTRIDTARRMALGAPPFPRCRVLLGKPRKVWDGNLELESGGQWIRFSTADWPCVVVQVDGGVAIAVAPHEADEILNEEVLSAAVAIAVENELGEECSATRIRDLSVVRSDQLSKLPGFRCVMSDLHTMIR